MLSNNSFSDLVAADKTNRHYAVLLSACTLFASLDKPSQTEIISFEELALRFLPKISLLERVEIVDILSKVQHLPRQVALSLACDDISVADPILNHYSGFQDNDLLMIMAKGSTLHALAISNRKNLSHKTLYALSHYKMAEFLDVEPRILISREKKTSISSDRRSLEFFLDQEEAYILSAMLWAEEKAQGQLPVDLTSLLIKARDNAEKAIDFVKLARNRDKQGFLKLLSTDCQLQEEDCHSIIDDPKGYALAICLKSLALPPATAVESFLLLNDKLARNTDQIFILDRFYSQITPAGCRFLLDHWQTKKQPLNGLERSSYQPVASGQTLSERLGHQTEKSSFQTSDSSGFNYKGVS